MIRFPLLLLAATTIAAACGRPGLTPRAVAEDPEEDAVYVAALQGMYGDDPVLVSSRTLFPNAWLAEEATRSRNGRPAAVPAEVAGDYLARSKERRNLRAGSLAGRPGTVVVAKAVLDRIREQERGGFWAEFEARYPDALAVVHLSRVGFSRDGTRAMLAVHHSCGFPCESGGPGVVVLAKRDGRWWVDDIPAVAWK